MDANKVTYLQNKLGILKARYIENEQLWFELYKLANPELPPEAGINGRRTEAVYNHTRDHISTELMFIQLEIELLKLGGRPDFKIGDGL